MTRGWMRSYALAATIAAIIATGAFVAYRNASYEHRECARAEDAARALAENRAPAIPLVAGGVVSPPTRSERYPFLAIRHRDGRPMGGPAAPASDKLLYDAAARAERDGGFVELRTDGSALIVAAVSTGNGVAIAVTHPSGGPERFPWLVVLGLLAMGAVVAAAGSLVGGVARSVGLALGGSGLAVPAHLWAGPAPAIAIVAISVALGVAESRGWLARMSAELRAQRVAYTFFAPAALGMLILVLTPFVIGLALGFYNHHHGEWTYVGLDNFADILSGDGRSLADPLNFWFTLGVTILWTAANVALHATIGVALALMLRGNWLAGKGIFRMLLILPWAIPNYITALIWRGMFQSEYGAINRILETFGLDKVSWFSSWATAFTANLTTNTWLGFPFMMVVALGALQTIPRDMYEAAEVDGASAWQRLWHITLPHLRPALAPALVLGAIWTFNMFNIIYLVSQGQPGGATDILVTDAYRWAFERGERYGLASAYATIIFLILLAWTILGTRVTREGRR